MSAPRCSAESLRLEEDLAGTAAQARSWIVIEQPGPWGRQALLSSRLDASVGQALLDAARDTGTTIVLGRAPDTGPTTGAGPRRIVVSHVVPGSQAWAMGTVEDPEQLLEWDLAAIAEGRLPQLGGETDASLILVCTNGTRDQCCAINGTRLVRDARRLGLSVWESSHLGGHRFAPTALVLPWGTIHGRLGLDGLARLAGGFLDAAGYRGRSALPQHLQAAEVLVRRTIDDSDPDSLSVCESAPLSGGIAEATVSHRDGRAWRMRLEHVAREPVRPESCGGPPVESRAWVCRELVAVAS